MSSWLSGSGVEVGAGSRPFPVRPELTIEYGDVRNTEELSSLFGTSGVVGGSRNLDAQTFTGVETASLDFVISAHVIEHLFDPVGAVRAATRVLKGGGLLLLTVPDMRFTFDHLRPETPLEHVLQDALDGGVGTRAQAYEEHVRYVHPVFCDPIPDNEVPDHVARLLVIGMDIHVHAWTAGGFRKLLEACAQMEPVRVEAEMAVADEVIFAVRKLSS